ncbi:MAG: hypothetical protein JRJ43_08530 [Deltaproteobacteria bacterium]|nr:hypothetical protein [Deltaproteobacteria bacterium]
MYLAVPLEEEIFSGRLSGSQKYLLGLLAAIPCSKPKDSSVMLRILRLKIDQRWPEDEMQNRGIIPLRVLSAGKTVMRFQMAVMRNS